jgi:hypothetical protein
MKLLRRAAGVAAIAMLACVTSAAAVTEPAGTAVVQPNPSLQGTTLWTFAADPSGITYVAQTPNGGPYVTYHRNPSDAGAVALDSQVVQPGGESVVNGVAALPQFDPNSGQATSVILKPLAGGATTTLPLASGEYLIGSTGDGIVVGRNLQSGDYGVDILVRRAGQTDVLLDHTANGTEPHGIVDHAGMALSIGGITLKYYDFAANTATTLNTDPNDYGAWLSFMTPTLIGWKGGLDHRTMVWVSRSGGTQHRVTVPLDGVTEDGFALSGTTLAWTRYINGMDTLLLEPADGSGTATPVLATLTQPNVIALPNGDFGVIARPTPDTFGIYDVTPAGQSSLLQPVASDWAKVGLLALSGNRVVFGDSSASPPPVYGLPFTRQAGAITLGSESQIGNNPYLSLSGGVLLASAGRSAWLTPNNTIVVADEGTVQRTITATSGSIALQQLSGDHLLYTANGSQQIMDLSTAASIPAPSQASLWGHFLYYQGTPGQILRRDWNKALSATNPVQVRAGDGCTILSMRVWGNWMQLDCVKQGGGVLALWNMKSGATIPLTTDRFAHGQLGDGVYAFIDFDTQGNVWVSAMDLTHAAHTVTPIGNLPNISPGEIFALNSSSGQSVAWVHPDNRIHIAPLPELATATSVWDKQTPRTVAAGASWIAGWDMSKPVSWTLTIKNSTATVVRTLTGTAADGSIRVTWNRTNDAHATVPKGTYTWALSAPGLDGRGTISQTGTIILK